VSYTFRPAVRENTPLIIGIGGPTKSGKTFSALRLATGLADGKPIAMINAEGPRGHQYADTFKYMACDIEPPYRPTRYTEALEAAAAIEPGAVIVDSASHAHDGPGGVLEWHEEILDRMAGADIKQRQRSTFAAWVEPKAAENQFIYAMLGMKCPVILCFRAKEKIKLVTGKDPIDLGWQPIAGERVAFETIFTLMLPPYSKGVPDLSISWMREPFDAMVPEGKPLDEDFGRRLAEWAKGSRQSQPKGAAATVPASGDAHSLFDGPANVTDRGVMLRALDEEYGRWKPHAPSDAARKALAVAVTGSKDLGKIDPAALDDLLTLARDFRKDRPEAVEKVMSILRPKKA